MKAVAIYLAGALLLLAAEATAQRPDIEYWDEAVRDRPTIAAVQQALQVEGYEPGAADGKLNPRTLQALKRAQLDRELEPTGRPDRRTVAALGVSIEGS